jgi:hypothetical protein
MHVLIIGLGSVDKPAENRVVRRGGVDSRLVAFGCPFLLGCRGRHDHITDLDI